MILPDVDTPPNRPYGLLVTLVVVLILMAWSAHKGVLLEPLWVFIGGTACLAVAAGFYDTRRK